MDLRALIRRTKTIHVLAVALVAVAWNPGARADDAACAAAADALDLDGAPTDCRTLAVQAWSVVTDRVNAFEGEDPPVLEAAAPAHPDTTGTQGTESQIAAAPSAQPTSLVGISLGLAGFDADPRTVGTISINPGALFASGSGDRRRLAQLSRFSDVSIVVPVNLSGDQGFAYFGVRARLNLLGLKNGGHAFDEAVEAVHSSYANLSGHADALRAEIERLFTTATDVVACYRAVVEDGSSTEGVLASCGSEWSPTLEYRNAERRARESLARVRDEADRFTAGLDLRYDYGNASATDAPQLNKSQLLVARFAVSAHLVRGTSTSLALRAGGGVVMQRFSGESVTSGDWSAAMELAFGFQGDSVRLSVGAEGREADDPVLDEALADTRYRDLRIGLDVPVSRERRIQAGLSFGLGPDDTYGRHGTRVVLSGDWNAILGER